MHPRPQDPAGARRGTGTFNRTPSYRATPPERPGGRWDTVDLVWLLIPVAVGIFALRAVLIARRLKRSAKEPAEADRRALLEARRALHAHREHLGSAVAAPKAHLAAAKNLRRAAPSHGQPSRGLDAMVEDFLPDRRS